MRNKLNLICANINTTGNLYSVCICVNHVIEILENLT